MVAYHRAWRATPTGAAKFRTEQKESKERYPDREHARRLARASIESGRLHRGTCEFADDSCAGVIDAHHDDYSRPLDVRWVCRAHHRHLDNIRRLAAAASRGGATR